MRCCKDAQSFDFILISAVDMDEESFLFALITTDNVDAVVQSFEGSQSAYRRRQSHCEDSHSAIFASRFASGTLPKRRYVSPMLVPSPCRTLMPPSPDSLSPHKVRTLFGPENDAHLVADSDSYTYSSYTYSSRSSSCETLSEIIPVLRNSQPSQGAKQEKIISTTAISENCCAKRSVSFTEPIDESEFKKMLLGFPANKSATIRHNIGIAPGERNHMDVTTHGESSSEIYSGSGSVQKKVKSMCLC